MTKFISGKIVRQWALIYVVGIVSAGIGFLMTRPDMPYSSRVDKGFKKIYSYIQRQPWLYGPEEARNRFAYSGFIRRDPEFVDDGYVLLSRYSRDEGHDIVELVRLKDYKTVHQWILPVRDVLERCGVRPNEYPYAQHPLLLKDGTLVFHIGPAGPLVKIDRDSKIMWVLNGRFHHSIELASDGNIFVCGVNEPALLRLPFRMMDDGYAVVTQEGKVMARFSAGKILMDNGYAGLFFGTGGIGADRLHINEAQPVDRDAGEARRGDVALSLRDVSTVMLFRPSTGKVVWLKTGPWIHQHDIDPLNDGGYSIFGNDGFRHSPRESNWNSSTGNSDIYLYDPVSGEVRSPFTSILQKIRLFTPEEGFCRILPNGDAFVEETCSSRIVRVASDKVRWEYVNEVAPKTAGALLWSRYLTADEFAEIGGGGL